MKNFLITVILFNVLFNRSFNVSAQIDKTDLDNYTIQKSIQSDEYLTINNNHKCPNTNVSFNVSGDSIVSYYWDFGDGSTSTSGNWYKTHIYAVSGNYLVKVTLDKQTGVDVILQDTVFVESDLPYTGYLNLNISKSKVCPNEPVTFNSWINSEATMIIDFGDGTNSTDDYITHSYSDTGTYIATLIATNYCGNDSSINKIIVVTNSNPYSGSIGLALGKLKVCPNQNFNYDTNVSSGNTFIIDFGDGTTSTLDYGSHSYYDLGVYTITLTATNVCGNDSSVYKTITVTDNLPYSGSLWLNLYSTKVCPNQPFDYSSNVNSNDSMFIDFGDGTISSIASGSHSYSDTGTYTVTLTAINHCGNDSSISKTIVVSSDIPYTGYMSLNIYETEVCPNQSFYYYSNIYVDNFIIDFGDGTTSNIDDGYHSYSATGLYTITLTGYNNCGNDSSISKTILVTNSIPFTDYIYLDLYKTEVCPNQNFNYNVSASGNSFIVDFGDGTTSTQEYGSHSYSTLGNHTITLTATNECGNSKTVSKLILVTEDIQSNLYLNISETEVCPFQSFYFSTYYNENALINFGDGTSTIENSGYHTYSTVGNYTITLTALNECGNSTSITETINVSTNIPVEDAYLDAEMNNVCPNTQIDFYANAPNDVGYLWNFGDGTFVSTSSSYISHSYSSIGTYQVSVKISNYCDNDTTLYYTINVNNNVPAENGFNINLYDDIICINQEVDYSISYSGNNSDYNFTVDYGDGTIGEVFLDHSYSNTGQYIVSLIGTNECGNSATSSETITVVDNIPITNAYMSVSESIICPNEEISFYAHANDIVKRIWNFDDGTIDTNTTYSNIYHTFSLLGTYIVSVKLINYCGSDTTLYITVNVADSLPFSGYLSLYISDTVLCPNQTFYYSTSYTYSNNSINFGDGTSSNYYSGTHFYSTIGIYTITLISSNYCSIADTITRTIIVTNNSVIQDLSYYASSNLICPNNSIYFSAYSFSNVIISYLWNFDDGTVISTTSYNIEHAFSNIGTYQVSVKLTDFCGADTTLFYNIEISNDIPYTNYIYLNTSEQVICPNQFFSYYSSSTEDFIINFGDGTTSTQHNGTHLYTTAGVYTISLTASNECGNDTTISESIIVASDMPIFESNINLNLLSNCNMNTIQFSSESGYLSYLWNFGDGTIEYGSHSISHTYDSIGRYNITLTITNQCGNQKILYRYVDVIDIDIPPYIYYVDNQPEVCPNEDATFSAEPQSNSYSWNFGNNTIVNGNNISHSFSTVGTYIVTVTATNSCGNQSTETTTITVNQNIIPNRSDYLIGDYYTEHCTNENIMFFVTPNGSSYLWDFGDGTTTTQTEEYQYFDYLLNVAYHKYSVSGIYIAHLTLTNGCGNSFTDSVQVIVKDNVTVNGYFDYDNSVTYSAGDEIDFFAAGGLSYSWDFGDGSEIIDTIGIISEITHTYYNSGTYKIKLIVSNECGIADTIYRNIYIYPSESKDITSFNFLSTNPDSYGIINNEYSTIYITVPYGTNITNLIPTITHSGVSISPLSGLAQNFSNIIYYTVAAEEGSLNTYSVIVSVAPSNASTQKAITSFSFQNFNPQVVATINETAKTINATVPYGSILTNLVATFTHTGESVIVNSVEQISGTTVNDFSSSLNYTVIAENASTATYSVNVVVTGIEEIKAQLSINIYPNPNNGNFTLEIENANNKSISLQIFDISGRNIFNQKFENKAVLKENINVSGLESGIYLVKIFDGENGFYKRILINR